MCLFSLIVIMLVLGAVFRIVVVDFVFVWVVLCFDYWCGIMLS